MASAAARYHGLDALRGIAMVLGIVLHASLPYIPGIPPSIWPTDNSSSYPVKIVFEFIHMWRMPLFFMLAGFFGHLVIARRSWRYWWKNRFLRIALPIVVFFPVMGMTLPWIWKYGHTGDFHFFYSNMGQPFHLWFLWQLLIFMLLSIALSLPYKGLRFLMLQLNGREPGILSPMFRKLANLGPIIIFRARIPIGFIVVCGVANFWSGGELIVNPLGSGMYFLFGFSLYKNPPLFSFLKKRWAYYLLVAFLVFSVYVILGMNGVEDITQVIYQTEMERNATKHLGLLTLTMYGLDIIGAVLFSMGFIGLAEAKFGSYNVFSRFLSDGSYWMYLIHLPIVALTTFFLFGLPLLPEIKFILAIGVTGGFCLLTYYYFVRATFIGVFLNGRRHRGLNLKNVCSMCGEIFENPGTFCTECGGELN